jgi:DNA-binding FadR family transcriptional regulator
MSSYPNSSEFLTYLAACPSIGEAANSEPHLPSLHEISKQLGVSVASLREQLEVARALGLVEVRPRTGIRRLHYSFSPAVSQSLAYALALDPSLFNAFSDLRNQVEASFWRQAVPLLVPEDITYLQKLLQDAWNKLNGTPVQIPQAEHRQLHLTIFRRLDNPFVVGIIEAYWTAYEAVGLNLYADYHYLQQVWQYHQIMVDSIVDGDIENGYDALIKHKDLLHHRPQYLRTITYNLNGQQEPEMQEINQPTTPQEQS